MSSIEAIENLKILSKFKSLLLDNMIVLKAFN